MAHRTQITLTDEQYERLRRESVESGLSIAELVRRALDGTHGSTSVEEKRAALQASFGAWKDRDFTGAEFVDRIRRPGLGHRLKRLGL
jgi:Ribbon-helix-helix protein, copG family